MPRQLLAQERSGHIVPPPGALQEFTAQSDLSAQSHLSAEDGREIGVAVIAMMQSGTNRLRGMRGPEAVIASMKAPSGRFAEHA